MALELASELTPEQLERLIEEGALNLARLLLAGRDFPRDVLDPALELPLLLAHLVEVDRHELHPLDFWGGEGLSEAAEEGVDHLEAICLQLVSLVVVHIGENHFPCFINDREERSKGLIVLTERERAVDEPQLPHALFLHQETDMLSAQLVPALLLERSAFRFGLQRFAAA